MTGILFYNIFNILKVHEVDTNDPPEDVQKS